MNCRDTSLLIGLGEVKEAVDAICKDEMAYWRGGLVPPNLLIELDPGNGRSTLAKYIVSRFQKHHICHFRNPDTLLEFRTDGSIAQLRQMFQAISASAVYTNAFDGLIAIDIMALADHVNESQVEFFLSEIEDCSQSSSLIFFTPGSGGKGTTQLSSKLASRIGHIPTLHPANYSPDELAIIALNNIKCRGIQIDDEQEVQRLLEAAVHVNGISRAKDATKLSEAAVRYADFSGITAIMTSEMLSSYLSSPLQGRSV